MACLPGEYAPNVAQLRTYGLRPEPLPVDGLGRADLEGIARLLRDDPPSFVHLTHIGSHRGLLQPAAEVAALCRDAGVPLVLDAAQSLGHVDVDLGADVVYGTSRKWLAGPRGVGVLVRPAGARGAAGPGAARSPRACRRCGPSSRARRTSRAGSASSWRSVTTSPPVPTGCASGSPRWGGPPGSCSTASAGWRVVEPVDEPTATTTLRPPDGVGVVETRTRLLVEHGIVTSAIGPERAPGEMTGPVLRISPHLDATVDDLEALAAAL